MEHAACELCREAKATVIKRFFEIVFFSSFFRFDNNINKKNYLESMSTLLV